MKLNHFVFGCIAFFTIATCYGAQRDFSVLQYEREQVTKQYLLDLKKADYKDIAQLFEKNGIVVSTSRGKANAKEFFYTFLPNVLSANTELHQTFVNKIDVNRLAVRFYLTYKLKNGEAGGGEYVDEFVFAENSAKLLAVYMFENLKFEL